MSKKVKKQNKKRITQRMKVKYTKRHNLPITLKEAKHMEFNDLIKMRWQKEYNELLEKERQKKSQYKIKKETDNFIIAYKMEERIGYHPSPNMPPEVKVGFDKKRQKKILLLTLYAGTYKSNKHNHSRESYITDIQEKTTLGQPEIYAVVVVELNRYSGYGAITNGTFYSQYFIGSEGGGFCTRVPATIDATIEDIEDFLKPAIVKKAEDKEKKVYRQGDVFFIETNRDIEKYIDKLPSSHKVVKENGQVKIVHSEHPTLILPHSKFRPILRKVSIGTYE